MATIRKRGMRWQVQVRRSNGYRASRSFLLRADADRWAREAEAEADRRLLQTDPSLLAKLRLADLLKRYEAGSRSGPEGSRRSDVRPRKITPAPRFNCPEAQLTPVARPGAAASDRAARQQVFLDRGECPYALHRPGRVKGQGAGRSSLLALRRSQWSSEARVGLARDSSRRPSGHLRRCDFPLGPGPAANFLSARRSRPARPDWALSAEGPRAWPQTWALPRRSWRNQRGRQKEREWQAQEQLVLRLAERAAAAEGAQTLGLVPELERPAPGNLTSKVRIRAKPHRQAPRVGPNPAWRPARACGFP